jgi:hypothetical protein
MNSPKRKGSPNSNGGLPPTVTLISVIMFVAFLFIYHHLSKNPSSNQVLIDFSSNHVSSPMSNYVANNVPETPITSFSLTIPSSNSQFHTKRNKHVKIAYIFAGSIRSFVCPRVHWSLRWNLIDALGGEAYTFIRTTTEDNANVHTGKGNIWTPQYQESDLEKMLSILNPRKIQYFSLSKQLEEMRKEFPTMIHRVFQENDLRRYSMFFHRCMAYRMALAYEKEHNIKFDWIALTRLDAAWLEPIYPIHQYTSDRVWLTETGYVPFNDQFMLIPRAYADYLYNLDTKVNPFVYCLGGPDVETWKCKREELIKRSHIYNSEEFINATLNHCCSDTIRGPNTLGYSETIHFRHLLAGHIPVGYARFPVYITRFSKKGICLPECSRLYHHFKGFIMEGLDRLYPYYAKGHALDTRFHAITDANLGVCTVVNSELSPWNPISAAEWYDMNSQHQQQQKKTTINQTYTTIVDYNQNVYDQVLSFHPSIPYNPILSLPWKIHTTILVDQCLTMNYTVHTLYWTTCLTHMKLKGGRRHYPPQTWFIHIMMHDSRLYHPLVLLDQPFLLPPYYHLGNLTRIYMPNRDARFFEVHDTLWCMTVIDQPRNNNTIYMSKCVKTYEDNPRQWFYTVRGLTQGSFPPSTVGLIRFAPDPRYCLVRDEDDIPLNIVKTSTMEVRLCDIYGPSRKYFEFELLNY